MANLKMPTISTAAAAEQKQPTTKGRARGDEREFVTTSVRFKPAVLAKLKKAAIDRRQSLQELIEIALSNELERDGVKIAGLRK